VRVIIDTNVFVSGVFFRGLPGRILEAWADGVISLVVSPEILDEYRRVGGVLASQFPGVDLVPILTLLTMASEIVLAPTLPEQVCQDPDDDKFVACALASRCSLIITGDRALQRVSGYRELEIISPRQFVTIYL